MHDLGLDSLLASLDTDLVRLEVSKDQFLIVQKF